MFKKIWCTTPHWKRLFMIVLLAHGAFNILFFEDYISLWETTKYLSGFFNNSLFYYFINGLPVLELSAGLLLLFGYLRKSLLIAVFYIFLIAGYYALDSNQFSSFLLYFTMAFFSLFVFIGHFYKTCDEVNKVKNIPAGEL